MRAKGLFHFYVLINHLLTIIRAHVLVRFIGFKLMSFSAREWQSELICQIKAAVVIRFAKDGEI